MEKNKAGKEVGSAGAGVCVCVWPGTGWHFKQDGWEGLIENVTSEKRTEGDQRIFQRDYLGKKHSGQRK